jgi:hypothetical protein
MPPSTRSRSPEKPAVPPPPVAGAAEGTLLADGPGVADGRGVADGPGVADGLTEGLTEGLPLALGPVRPAVPLGRMVGDTDPVAPGENVAGVAGVGDPEQAETDAAARMVKVAQPTAANLVLSPAPAMVMRILYRPSRRPFKAQGTARSRNGLVIT